MSGEVDNVTVDIAFLYTVNQAEVIYSFVNNINTHEGGTHVSGFRTALTRVINDVGKAQGYLKEKMENFKEMISERELQQLYL